MFEYLVRTQKPTFIITRFIVLWIIFKLWTTVTGVLLAINHTIYKTHKPGLLLNASINCYFLPNEMTIACIFKKRIIIIGICCSPSRKQLIANEFSWERRTFHYQSLAVALWYSAGQYWAVYGVVNRKNKTANLITICLDKTANL